MAAMAPGMFSSSAGGEPVARFLESVRSFRPSGFRAMAHASYEDQTHVLSEVDVPTLFLYADHDARAPLAVGGALHTAVLGSELVVLAGPGHVSPVEAPAAVTREMRAFLRRRVADGAR